METKGVVKRIISLSFVFILFIACTGCATFKQDEYVVVRDDEKTSKVKAYELITREEYQRVDLYAMLSTNIYQSHLSANTNTITDYCENDSRLGQVGNWEKISANALLTEPEGQWFVPGLEYEVWGPINGTEEKEVVIVFRGTDFTTFGDWYSNLRWLTRFIPLTWDQYDQVRDVTLALVESIKDQFGSDVRIIATGHSLGGGLAQQAGYMSADIDKVYAFAPSPVTGFYSVAREDRKKNKQGMDIYRIYEHGEVLAYLRLIMKMVYPVKKVDPKITEVRYDVMSEGHIIKQHGMKRFACELHKIASRQD